MLFPDLLLPSTQHSPSPKLFKMNTFFSSNFRSSPVPVTSISKPTWYSSIPIRIVTIRCCPVQSFPTLDMEKMKFLEAAREGNVVPIYKCIFGDQLTPVLAYRYLVKENDKEAPSFLFESVEPGLTDSTIGRYSVVGSHPAMEIVAKENKVTIVDHEEGSITEKIVDDPMKIPRIISESWKAQLLDELPDVFCGGWVGFFSYDTVRYVEPGKLPFSNAPRDDRNLPDIHLGLYHNVIVFDHVHKKACIIHWVQIDRYSSAEKAYIDGTKHLDALVAKVQNNDPPKLAPGSVDLNTHHFGSSLKQSSTISEEFKDKVRQAKEHIFAGDVFQLVLSQCFEKRTFADPFEVYRASRIVNPSPYMSYIQARGCALVACSPEILTRVEKNTIVNRLLTGTIIRGKNHEEDLLQEMKLLNDQKQCAEHIMLVDLAKNDVGKVSKPGSVNVVELRTIERYSNVMHISSTITGELLDDVSCWDALCVALPVGTVTGAPKVKAMQLIDKFEKRRRGPNSGGLGSISFSGDMNIALTQQTIVFATGPRHDTMYSYKDGESRQEWVAYLQASTTILADSIPDAEQTECENKAAGLARAIDLAESAFALKQTPLGYNREFLEIGIEQQVCK